jgi:hypothetical protein
MDAASTLKTGRELDDDLWVFERPLVILGLRIGTRMTVVRLRDGSLFLHSPVELDADTRADLDRLGPVRFVVAPNRLHHLFVAPYREAFPEAQLWAAPGLREKKPAIAFDHVLGDAPPGGWAADIDQLLVEGIPHVNEVVFLHRKTRTLLLTDLAMNFGDATNGMTRLWLRLMGLHRGFATSHLMRRLVRDRAALRASFAQILSWDFERVTVTHGVVLQRSGKRVLRAAWSWAGEGEDAPHPPPSDGSGRSVRSFPDT